MLNDINNIKRQLKRIDSFVILLGLLYIIVPILIFLLKFTRPGFFIFGLILFLYLIFKVMASVPDGTGFSNEEILNRKSLLFILISTVVFCVWIFFSGIGSFSFQNWDFWVRNPIYNDLINKPWPLYYNLEAQPEYVTNLIGGEWVAFAYYFTFWLTPACICKVMNFTGTAAQIILYMYALCGVIIINYLLSRLFKKFSWKITAILMMFSGLDVVAYLIQNLRLPALTEELEWSLLHYQLSGNTTQLYYVFNQSIPIWIIMLLILNIDVPAIMAGIASICFAYSPWATIGLVPLTAIGMLTNRKDLDSSENKSSISAWRIIKNCISIVNILVPVFLLLIFGLYYTASSGSDGGKGFYFFTTEATLSEYIIGYVIFILTEFVLFYIAMGKKVFSYRYSLTVLIELALFPLFYIVDFNFFIRGTIPALFILMVIAISYIVDETPSGLMRAGNTAESTGSISESANNFSIRKKIFAALLIIGALNSVVAISRSVIYTAQGGDYLQSDIQTFDDMTGANEYQILTTNSQFFVHGFATKPFYMFISKRGL